MQSCFWDSGLLCNSADLSRTTTGIEIHCSAVQYFVEVYGYNVVKIQERRLDHN